jgi:ketosteroid isomerase-like protein
MNTRTLKQLVLGIFMALAVVPFAGPANGQAGSGEAEVRKASDQFYAALNRMFVGDLAPMVEVWSHSDDVTNMGPFGPRQEGWKQVREQFEREAKLKLGGKVVPKDVLVRVAGDLGYTVCVYQT